MLFLQQLVTASPRKSGSRLKEVVTVEEDR
jgi:hypothetical protein